MKSSPRIEVSVEQQTLRVLKAGKTLRTFPVSTSARGIGFEPESFRTPVGNFVVAGKIGGGAPPGTIFKARQPVGIWQPGNDSGHDLVLTRILILEGVDTRNRYTRERHIYVHGTNREDQLGQPASMGCIRLSNRDMVELFDLVPQGTPLVITPPRRSDMKLLFLDCDSTLSSIEGIDELAAAAGPKVHREVVNLTNAAMNGEVPLDEVFPRRMNIIRPDAATCRRVADRYLATIQPGAAKAIAKARALGWTPVILSGGFAPLIAPLAAKLGIHHVEAVPLRHDGKGRYVGYETRFPTTRGGGKAEVIRQWIEATRPACAVMVGDGASDLETLDVVDAFIAYTGVVKRAPVVARASTAIRAWNALPSLLDEITRKHRAPSNMSRAATNDVSPGPDYLLAASRKSHSPEPVMSAKKKTGIRYSPEEKAKVIAFVKEHNQKKGRGGQAAAVAKFGITALTLSRWMRGTKAKPQTTAKSPAKKPAGKPAAPAKGATKGTAKAAAKPAAAPAGFSAKLRKLADLNDAIAATEAQLAKLKAEFKAAKQHL